MEVKVRLVKAFTRDKDNGNPAGIVMDGSLSVEQMRKVASETGFPTTAFVHGSVDAYSVRFFSAMRESRLCVHAALAAAHIISEESRPGSAPMILQTKAGDFNVEPCINGPIFMEMAEPVYSNNSVKRKEVAEILRIEESDLADHDIQIVSTGKPKLLVPIRTLDRLLSANPDTDKMKGYCRRSGAEGFFLFSPDERDDSDYYARHFNPLTLEAEDPICGVGSGALAAYVQKNGLMPKKRFLVRMGHTTGTEGHVIVDVSDGIKVGGYCATFGEKTIKA